VRRTAGLYQPSPDWHAQTKSLNSTATWELIDSFATETEHVQASTSTYRHWPTLKEEQQD
jgi:hypothetical protein